MPLDRSDRRSAVRNHSTIGLGALSAIMLSAAVARAEPDPSAPAGWTASTVNSLTLYSRANGSAAVEFRLHPAVASEDALPAWFAKRFHTAPTGIQVDSFGEAKQTDTAAYTAVHRGMRASNSAGVVVMAMGCKTHAGAFRYGELILPPDMALINASAPSAAGVMAQACIETQMALTPPVVAASQAVAAVPAPAVNTMAAKGTGLGVKQLEAILFSWEQVFEVTGLQLHENAYLLLKDGSYRNAVPQESLDDFDLSADKTNNAKRWGTWRKEGVKYQLAERGAAHFHTPDHQTVQLPARPGETLNGSWSAGSGGTVGAVGYWSTTSVSLGSDGRFTRSSSGGAGGSSSPGADYNVTTLTVHNDEGSAAAVGSTVFGGGGSSKNGKTIANRSGSYRLDGFTMELHYDDGRVVRQLFFTNNDRSFIWFAGSQLMKQKK
jgi:hypothetical protein